MKHKHILLGVVLLGMALFLAACSGQPGPVDTAACPTAEACPDCPTCPDVTVKEVPFEALWAASPHNDATAEAFIHWNEDDPKEVPADCAKCHSTPGYLDFLGEDGSAAGTVDKAAEIGTTITCVACHNASTAAMTSVVFPSGAEVTGLGAEARCMQCHQGRASKAQVDAALEDKGLTEDLDTVNAELGFVNIHYFAAAATLYGTQTKGGYEYEGKAYDYKNDHVAGFDTCIGCHNSHTLEVKVDSCKTCHTNVNTAEDLKSIRMQGSLVDYDGDGDVTESVASELEGMQGMLLQAIQAYAKEVAGTPVVYDLAAYPYFFVDTNDNGAVDEGEAAFPNAYKAWTGRMLKAAYNYQTSVKDPGAYAHGGKYMIQLVYDSIEDLNSKISTPVDLSAANRLDSGHFAGSEEAFRHWDEEGEVPGNCARCHSASGLPTFLKNGANIAVDPVNGLNCATCHNDLATFTRFAVNEVTMPSGAKVTFGEANDANLCMTCHQGRESKKSVDGAITAAGVGDNEVSEKLRFRNPHYFAAGATLFGTDAKGAYEFEGEAYNGRFMHVEGFNTCIGCHDGHALKVKEESCTTCHTGITELTAIRMTEGDFDGDGDAAEGMAGEVTTMQEKLYAAIQAYAAETAGAGLVYSGSAYPYFFVDTNADGVADPEELNSDNAFAAWTPNLLRAAYNYQWASKDPGAFAHNGKYILQVLYDSLAAMGGDTAGMTRP